MTSAGNETEYAFWADDRHSFKVQYSLPVFHEIDFQVNEGYRRIPHGGVEIGGVLYGKAEANTLSVEAFRPIECEHAAGPSFNLSPRDLDQLAASLAVPPSDEEFNGLVPLGWFIAHTRGPLRMTERELQLFDQFFPGPGRITLLIKPERFQPTRFGFLLRGADGSVKTDASDSAVILPLPGRAGGSSKGVVPSIPAPAVKAAVREKEPARADEPVETQPVPPKPAEAQEESAPETVLPSMEEIRKRRSEHLRNSLAQAEPVSEKAATRPLSKTSKPSHGRLLWVLMLAGLLGCAVGYWAYLQLSPPDIDLRVHKYGPTLLVQWTPGQTQSSGYAAIRIDDGPMLPLTAAQRASGQVEIKQTSDNMKIELTARHWVRDSHGIVRFVSLPAQ